MRINVQKNNITQIQYLVLVYKASVWIIMFEFEALAVLKIKES